MNVGEFRTVNKINVAEIERSRLDLKRLGATNGGDALYDELQKARCLK